MTKNFICCLLSLLPVLGMAQGLSWHSIGPELQIYPTGIIPGLRAEWTAGEKSTVHIRIGANLIDHRDLGVQDDETGSGYGFTLGYRRFFDTDYNRWFLGIKSDLWRNTIDWKNAPDTPLETSGTSNITVLQPTLEGGYSFALSEKWSLAPSLAFGYEVNVLTDGEEVGQGPILLLGLHLAWR